MLCKFVQGITTGAVRFRFDGNPINDDDTPSIVSMKSFELIMVIMEIWL